MSSPPPEAADAGAGTIDPNPDDDEGYYESLLDTVSLDSYIRQYRNENGRRYHAYKDGTYFAPNDERQQTAEDISHEIFRRMLGANYLAPIEPNPKNVLDVGCGTGIWAIEFADQHPGANVIGIDLSPIQPNLVPPNVEFLVDDINDPWIFDEEFDYIHVRCLNGCVPDWRAFHQETFCHLKPGGWVEQVELSARIVSDDWTLPPMLAQWGRLFQEIGDKSGMAFAACEEAFGSIKAVGFGNLQEEKIKMPIGPWAKNQELASGASFYLLEALEGLFLRGLTTHLGWSATEASVYVAKARQEIKNLNVPCYIPLTVVWGQKPKSCDRLQVGGSGV